MEWQRDGECAEPNNKGLMEAFFDGPQETRNEAKNLCFVCPVRRDCLQWAMEHKQIWGIWGGNDETEIRRNLSVDMNGEEVKRSRPPHCPFCNAWPSKLSVSIEKLPGGGRWTTAKVVTCSECDFSWRSRTSANAIEAYKANKASRKAVEPSHTPEGSVPASHPLETPQGPSGRDEQQFQTARDDTPQ